MSEEKADEEKVAAVQLPKVQRASLASFLNNAGIMALLTAGLYFIGWNYWRAYYSFYSIPADFIDTDLGHILPQAWSGIALILWNIYMASKMGIDEALDSESGMTWTTTIGYILLMIPVVILPLISNAYIIIAVILLCMVLAFMPARVSTRLHRFSNTRLQMGRMLSAKSFQLYFTIVVFSYLCMLQSASGKKAAQDILRSNTRRIDIITDGSRNDMTNMLLISHSYGKYFMCHPNDTNMPPRVDIVDDAIVVRASLTGSK